MTDPISPLVKVHWLHEHVADPNVLVLDASVEKIVGKEPLLYEHFQCIPNSIHCDIDADFHNSSTGQPHSMPSAELFSKAAGKLGVTANSHVVVYDNQGLYSAPRVWWMFKALGHQQVSVLDGGLPEWQQAGLPVATDYAQPPPTVLKSSAISSRLVTAKQIVASLPQHTLRVVDARSSGRFNGTAAEPRAGLRSGHIPGSINIPFADVLNGFCLKSEPELRKLFEHAGLKHSEKIAASCGSGLTACIILLAARVAGFEQLALYDGSWAEWGADDALPIDVAADRKGKGHD